MRDRNNNIYGDITYYTIVIDGHRDIDYLCEAIKIKCDLLTFTTSDFQLFICTDKKKDEWKNIFDLKDIRLIQDLSHYIIMPNPTNPIKVVLPISLVCVWFQLSNEDLSPYEYTTKFSLTFMSNKSIEEVCSLIKKEHDSVLRGVKSNDLRFYVDKILLKKEYTFDAIPIDYNISFPNSKNPLIVVVSSRDFFRSLFFPYIKHHDNNISDDGR